MRDYAELIEALRYCSINGSDAPCNKQCPYYAKRDGYECIWEMMRKTADAIEELLAGCRDVAAFVICFADDDEVSAEVLCRKLHKIGVVEKDGAWWTLPEPPKEVK